MAAPPASKPKGQRPLSWRWLDPSWLFGILAVVLPILVHLWGRGRGREVVVASLRWFGDGVSTFARRWRPSDLALLIVRCALVMAMALALAQPRAATRPVAKEGTWIVVEPAVLEEEQGRLRLEQLRAESPQSEVRWLVPGAPPVGDGQSPAGADRWRDDQWAALAAVGEVAPPGVDLVLLTRDRLAALPGARPVLTHDVTWIALETPDSVDWLGTESHPVIRRESSAEATRLEMSVDEDIAGRTGLEVLVEVAPERREDGALARRAVESLKSRGWRVSLASEGGGGTVRILLGLPDLPDDPALPDGGFTEGARWVLLDGEGPERACRGTVRPSQVVPRPFPMMRCLGSEWGRPLWSAPDGQPLLTQTASPDRTIYRFASRLHPSWSGLDATGWADWLEERWLHDGLLPSEVTPLGLDRRRSFSNEQEPRRAGPPSEVSPRFHPWPETVLWWLVAGLLLAERWMQRRRS
ncbi:MAG: BatA domain-containing protein [Thermoanaerobaculia bacterium]|nr:BatA domain-containing protein [Thermoanaerobaculia bacterium]